MGASRRRDNAVGISEVSLEVSLLIIALDQHEDEDQRFCPSCRSSTWEKAH
jgi:hypothetical protein